MGRITEEFVWKYCVLVWYYWGTNGDFVGNYWETRLAAVRNSRGHCRELVGIREDFLRNPCGSTGEFLRHYLEASLGFVKNYCGSGVCVCVGGRFSGELAGNPW